MARIGDNVRKVSDEALQLLKDFEGLELTAYPDPGTGGRPYTIGYGRAYDVRPGDRITPEKAEQMLREDLASFQYGVEKLFEYVEIGPHTFDALVSFAYNCGLGALETSTMRKRIMRGEDPYVVLPEELPRWVKGGKGQVMAGLVERRKRETLHAQKDGPRAEDGINEPIPVRINFQNFFDYYKAEAHQVEGIRILEEQLKKDAPHLLKGNADWVKAFRDKSKFIVELPCPYQYQLDSDTNHAGRMCFSSTNAMLVEYLKPGRLRGEQEDDAFLRTVLKYGDTTSAEAQVSALKMYGINASFRMDGTAAHVKNLLSIGVPVPVGILHHHHFSNPSGGHWVLLVGFDDEQGQYIAHDPFGCMNVIHGGYVSNLPTAGRFVRYDYAPFNARWMVAGSGDGWFLEVRQ